MLNIENIINLITLTSLEIILGIDNLIFIVLLLSNVPNPPKKIIFNIGLSLAFLFRIIFLITIYDITKLTDKFNLLGMNVSIKEIVFFLGGLFLVVKPIIELFKLAKKEEHASPKISKSYFMIALQIIFVDVVFSFDSVLVAVAIVKELYLVVIAVFISMVVMYLFRDIASSIVANHPTIKIIAICFVIFLGFNLTFKSFGVEISKNYLYAILVFSSLVEAINIKLGYRK